MTNPLPDIETLNRRFAASEAAEIIAWSATQPGPLVLSSSFGAEAVVMLELVFGILRLQEKAKVVFIDTSHHFPETYTYRQAMQDRYGFTLVELKATNPQAADPLTNSERCCYLNKVKIFNAFLNRDLIWLSGIRRSQTRLRKHAQIVMLDSRVRLKINPIFLWDDEQTATFIVDRGLPLNPLVAQGYPSIGCQPCTCKPTNDNPRSGRWAQTGNDECGLHCRV